MPAHIIMCLGYRFMDILFLLEATSAVGIELFAPCAASMFSCTSISFTFSNSLQNHLS